MPKITTRLELEPEGAKRDESGPEAELDKAIVFASVERFCGFWREKCVLPFVSMGKRVRNRVQLTQFVGSFVRCFQIETKNSLTGSNANC